MQNLHCTIIQTDLFWEDKSANLSMLQDKILAIKEKTHIVILPEMFSTGFSMTPEILAESMHGETIQWMIKLAINKKVILTGSVMIKENNHYYNRLIWVLPNGEIGFYDKRHLFGYGKENEHYTPGNKRLIVSVNGWKINLCVCYDLRFPVWARQTKSENTNQPEYDLLIYVANWPEKRSHAWRSLLVARAIENQCYVVGVNRIGEDGNNIYHSGDSMVIGPLGETLFSKQHEECVQTIILEKSNLDEVRLQFPFLRDADTFILPT
ncbi:MAG: amidohydrolase [Bacteroidetes bacterium]|nr:amidohydrolase [Bacteroidota bacterium]